MQKKFLSLVMAFCLVLSLSVTAFADSTTLQVTADDTLPAVGGMFEVTVSIDGNPGFSALQLTLSFDRTAVECISITKGDVLLNAIVSENPAGKNGAIFSAASSRSIDKNGTLMVCTFKMLQNADPAFSLKNTVLNATDGSSIPYSPEISYSCPPAAPEVPAPEVPAPEETPTAPSFSDVPSSHWASSFVEKASEMGLITGYDDGTFRPSNHVTRAQFVTMLWRLAGKPECHSTTPFTDISALREEFKTAIAWAYENGYIGGRTSTTFAPSDSLSRQAAMKILFLYSGSSSDGALSLSESYDAQFADSSTLASWAKAPMYWGVFHKLINGTTTTTLGAKNPASRAQLAKILVNYSKLFSV